MQDNNNNPVSASIATLTVKVEGYKLIAREALRMNLINPRLTKIADVTAAIASVNKCKDNANHLIKVENYEISKLDEGHPNYADKKASKENTVKMITEQIENLDKDLVELEKLMKEQKEGILKIESGETKVSLDSLNCLVEEMIRENALSQAKVA